MCTVWMQITGLVDSTGVRLVGLTEQEAGVFSVTAMPPGPRAAADTISKKYESKQNEYSFGFFFPYCFSNIYKTQQICKTYVVVC